MLASNGHRRGTNKERNHHHRPPSHCHHSSDVPIAHWVGRSGAGADGGRPRGGQAEILREQGKNGRGGFGPGGDGPSGFRPLAGLLAVKAGNRLDHRPGAKSLTVAASKQPEFPPCQRAANEPAPFQAGVRASPEVLFGEGCCPVAHQARYCCFGGAGEIENVSQVFQPSAR